VDIVDDSDPAKILTKDQPQTADTLVFLQGTLKSGVALSLNLRGGPQFKGTPALDWRIYGSDAEIRITSSSPVLEFELPGMTIQIHDFATDTVEDVPMPTDHLTKLGPMSSNTGRLYDDIYEGWEKKTHSRRVLDFEESVKIQELIDHMYKENGHQI
jgi:predicted dehydrogenase